MGKILEIGICVGIKVMPEKISVCRAEKDLKLTSEIDVEPGNINFPLGGLLLQML
jgi:hypothetical protein